MQRLLMALTIVAILIGVPTVAAGDDPPGYGNCQLNEDDGAVWLENHDGTYWVVVNPHYRPIDCAF